MSTDLRTLLHDAAAVEEQHAARTAPDPDGELRRITRHATRRRAVRSGAAGIAAAAAVAVGAVTLGGLPDGAPQPPATPAPDDRRDDDGAPDGRDDDGVTRDPALPDAAPLEPGMLESAAPGSLLVLYAPEALDDPTLTVLYLVEPDGILREVPYAGPAPRVLAGRDTFSVVEWLSGSTLALTRSGTDERGTFALRDLLTGEEVLDLAAEPGVVRRLALPRDGTTDVLVTDTDTTPPFPEGGSVLSRVAADGTVLAEAEGGGVVVQRSPDRTALVTEEADGLVVRDATTLERRAVLAPPPQTAPGACSAAAWTADGVVLTCPTVPGASADPGAWLAPADGGEPVALPVAPVSVWGVGDGTALRPAPQDASDRSLALVGLDGDLLVSLRPEDLGGPVRLVASAGDRLLGVVAAPEGDAANRLVAVDPASGTVLELVGPPESPRPGVGISVLGVVDGDVRPEAR